MSTAIVTGSVGDVARRSGRTLAEAFLFVDAIVIVDTSASMAQQDVPKSELKCSRYDEAVNQLRQLQTQMPGKIAVISFSNTPVYCPDGNAKFLRGSTNLAAALRLVQAADNCGLRFVVISDGEPDNEMDALDVARGLKTRIDTIYIGPPNGKGIEFLQRLASIHGGQAASKPGEVLRLSETVQRLLE